MDETTADDQSTSELPPEGTPPSYAPLPKLAEALRRSAQRFVTATTNQDAPTPEDLSRAQMLAEQVQELGAAIELLVPECRDKALALTHLEDVLTRANRAIYLKDPVGGRSPALADQE